MEKILLFSVDLEDMRQRMPDGERYRPRVPEMTQVYLAFLDRHGFKATFFVVGETAEANPDVIRSIVDAGHEVALHSLRHTPIDRLGKEGFLRDIESNINILKKLGVPRIRGFRAPIVSMTQQTAWAYPVLAGLGLDYSSSVLPAKNSMYGWPGHGSAITTHEGIVELPITLVSWGALSMPCAAGVYFRVLPYFFLKRGCDAAHRAGRPVIGYFHPYDIDVWQERFMQPDIRNSRFLNYLMYYNRTSVFPKLDALLAHGYAIMRYDAFVDRYIHEQKSTHH